MYLSHKPDIRQPHIQSPLVPTPVTFQNIHLAPTTVSTTEPDTPDPVTILPHSPLRKMALYRLARGPPSTCLSPDKSDCVANRSSSIVWPAHCLSLEYHVIFPAIYSWPYNYSCCRLASKPHVTHLVQHLSSVRRESSYLTEMHSNQIAVFIFLALLRKLASFYGTRKFLTVLERDCHSSLSWASLIWCTRTPTSPLSHLTSLRRRFSFPPYRPHRLYA